MSRGGSGPVVFWEPLVGLVFVGAGVASVGVLLVAAGGGHASVALLLTGAAVLLLGAGLALMRHSGRHGGGILGSQVDDEQRRRYRVEFRRWRSGR
jgi:hypothetical protein